MQRSLTAAATFAGLIAFALSSQTASAISLAKSPAAPGGIVQLTRPGGGGGGHHGGGGGGHHGGGGGGGHHGGGGGGHHGGGHGGGWGHGPRGGHGGWGGPRFRAYPYIYGFGAYPYYYYNDFGDDYDCEPLRRRAQATGKRYWWNRYYACIED